MKHDKNIGKVIYSTPQDQAIKEFRYNWLKYFVSVIFLLFGLAVSVGMIAYFFVYNHDAWLGLAFGVIGLPVFGFYLIGTLPTLYSTELYTIGDKGVIITQRYLSGKMKEYDRFMFADASRLEITQNINYRMGGKIVGNISHITDNYSFIDDAGKVIHEETLTYVNPTDLDKQHKKEYVQTLIDAFERYRITRKR